MAGAGPAVIGGVHHLVEKSRVQSREEPEEELQGRARDLQQDPRFRYRHVEPDSVESIHYTRDPKVLTAYLIPFPRSKEGRDRIHGQVIRETPPNFFVYTPPPPPLVAPEGEQKEPRLREMQRKFESDVRLAKQNPDKFASYPGMKERASRKIDQCMKMTVKSPTVEFLGRLSEDDDSTTFRKTVGLDKLVLYYSGHENLTEKQMKQKFVDHMLQAHKKGVTDEFLATGYLPAALAADVLLTPIWPFGGAVEITAYWGMKSHQADKTAKSMLKRINASETPSERAADHSDGNPLINGALSVGSKVRPRSGGKPGDKQDDQPNDKEIEEPDTKKLGLKFVRSSRIDIMEDYFYHKCRNVSERKVETIHLFTAHRPKTTVMDVIDAMGWAGKDTDLDEKNWEDDQFELREVMEDVDRTFVNVAEKWVSWVEKYQRDPQQAMKHQVT